MQRGDGGKTKRGREHARIDNDTGAGPSRARAARYSCWLIPRLCDVQEITGECRRPERAGVRRTSLRGPHIHTFRRENVLKREPTRETENGVRRGEQLLEGVIDKSEYTRPRGRSARLASTTTSRASRAQRTRYACNRCGRRPPERTHGLRTSMRQCLGKVVADADYEVRGVSACVRILRAMPDW